jgi:hypothetical protein
VCDALKAAAGFSRQLAVLHKAASLPKGFVDEDIAGLLRRQNRDGV